MLRFKFAKLVRDKIVEHQLASGATPTYYQLDIRAHKEALIQKIIEESQEILDAKSDEIASEIADVQQAIDDLKALNNLTDDAIASAQKVKNDKNGTFSQGIFIEHVEVDENDPWVTYYRKNADRYPEIKA